MRLRAGLAERGAVTSEGAAPVASPRPAVDSVPQPTFIDDEMRAYYRARAATYDDWYLRRGVYSHGPIDDLAWQMELDTVTLWLDALPLAGEIVELAAGTGWWSPLLAGKGELWCYDAVPETLDLARQRLVAHGLRAHLHARDAWTEPDRTVDAVVCGFWLSHVPRDRLPAFLAIARRWLRPGGTFAFIDSRRDRSSGATGNAWDAASETATRRIGEAVYRIPKVYYEPAELADALTAAGFAEVSVQTTPRFFVYGSALAST
jgi:demethylmenaquinone methyltransferase/2-methoxy-6-polyprenyl-1,4-benzoquinol methylase